MFYVYILRSLKSNKLYTGFTSNLKQRVGQHFSGTVHTTSRMGKIELLYYEAFKDKLDATEREFYLKTTKGKRTLRLMLRNSLSPLSSSLV